MRDKLLICIILICSVSVSARKVQVSSATEVNNGNWNAGDTLVWRNGTYSNQSISLKANGLLTNPIVLMAETAGNVIFNGTSKIGFSGTFIEVSGFYFKNGTLSGSDVISFRTSSAELAENCRLTNCTIANYNPADNTVDSKWVSIFGKNNKVDHCSFENKNNSGTLLVVWLVNGVTVNHIIDSNYFGFRNSNLTATGSELNGQEIIRVGDSSTSMTTASVIVHNNFLEHCNGEIEVISNKSCGNLYSNNVFFECHGMLTLRHGNGCTVNGNYFFGNGVKDSGGVRVIGENHKVYNNYFDNLRGTGYRAAISMVRGKLNSLANEYFQVKNAVVAFNTFVDCTLAFNINYNSSTLLTLPPIGSTIAHNHVYNSNSTFTNVIIDQNAVGGLDVTWKNNLMNQGKYTDFSYTTSQLITGKDAKMMLAGTTINMFEPTAGSALNAYISSDCSEVIQDIRGRNRGAFKIPGASQLSGLITSNMPDKSTIGASYFNKLNTEFKSATQNSKLQTYMSDNKLISKISVAGELKMYDALGRILIQTKINEGVTSTPIHSKGIFIVIFKALNGEYFVNKVVSI